PRPGLYRLALLRAPSAPHLFLAAMPTHCRLAVPIVFGSSLVSPLRCSVAVASLYPTRSAPRSLRSSLVPRCDAHSLSPRCTRLARLRARSAPRSFLAAMLTRCRLASAAVEHPAGQLLGLGQAGPQPVQLRGQPGD